MSILVEDLIESVKSRSFVPISQATFQDSDIIRILNEELTLKLVSDITNAREDFFLSTLDRPMIAGKGNYLLPPRAIGNAIKAVFYVDGAGNQRALPRRDVDRAGEISSSATGDPEYFYFLADEVIIQPKPAQSVGYIRFVFGRKPNTLVLTSSCAKITGVTSLAGVTTFTVDTDLTATLSFGSLRGAYFYEAVAYCLGFGVRVAFSSCRWFANALHA